MALERMNLETKWFSSITYNIALSINGALVGHMKITFTYSCSMKSNYINRFVAFDIYFPLIKITHKNKTITISDRYISCLI